MEFSDKMSHLSDTGSHYQPLVFIKFMKLKVGHNT